MPLNALNAVWYVCRFACTRASDTTESLSCKAQADYLVSALQKAALSHHVANERINTTLLACALFLQAMKVSIVSERVNSLLHCYYFTLSLYERHLTCAWFVTLLGYRLVGVENEYTSIECTFSPIGWLIAMCWQGDNAHRWCERALGCACVVLHFVFIV